MCCVGWHGLVPTELADREALFSSCPSSYPTSTFWGWLMGGREEEGWVLFLKHFHRCLLLCVSVCVCGARRRYSANRTNSPFFISFLPVAQTATPDGQIFN
jgi:hypothetical protein